MADLPYVTIDGSQGEGGGQILRSALAIAAVAGQPIFVEKIRSGRKKPGLMRQHLTAVRAIAEICNAELNGASPGSQSLSFTPKAVQPGAYEFRIGTAGSVTLVLQTILPALLTASGPSTVILEGGTHNPWAPPFDFLKHAWLPLVNRMGPQVTVELQEYGFFPAGGGRMILHVQPAPLLRGFDLPARGELLNRNVSILISNLPRSIATREARRIAGKLQWESVEIQQVSSAGPGNLVIAQLQYQHVTEVFTGFGRLGVSAEQVVQEVVRQVRRYLVTDAPVGEYLADQILLPLGLSASATCAGADRKAGGTFRTLRLSRHSTTHLQLLQALLPISISVESDSEPGVEVVTIGPRNSGN